jgi:membrane-associated phospholipid phosphatase
MTPDYAERAPPEAAGISVLQGSGPLMAWPGWAHVRWFLALWMAVALEFVVIFGGGDFITAHRQSRLHFYLQSELAIPLIPSMVVVYMSIYWIFLPAPFVLRSRQEINALAIALAKVILIAGMGFLLFPAQLGFPPTPSEVAQLDPVAAHRWGRWLLFADQLNLDYDLIPSLHVALFVTCATVYAVRAGVVVRSTLATWAAAVAASTVLTHQHQVVDVIAGVALGVWGAVEVHKRQGWGAT